MKKLIIGVILTSLLITQPVANAGDKEWAVAGKILTGLFVLDKIVTPQPTVVYTQQPVVVQQQPVVVQQQPVVVQQQPVVVQQQPVVVQQPPVIIQQPPVVYQQIVPSYYSQFAPSCSVGRRSSSIIFHFGSRASYNRECTPRKRR